MKLNARRKDMLLSTFFLVPALLLFFVFLLYPIIQAVVLSFFKWNGIAGSAAMFNALENYKFILSNPLFWLSLRNSLFFMLGGFLILMPLAFLLAQVITSEIRFKRFFKTAFFMPVMLPLTAVGLMWVYILDPNWGLINTLFKMLGLTDWARNWLGTPNLNVVTVVLVNEWIYSGLNMLIFAAGLVSIPVDTLEAARIDGASGMQRLFSIVIPQMKQSFKVFSVICVTGSLKTFDLIYAMTGGGPNHSSELPATLLYSQAFTYKNFGAGNAIGTIILLLGLILSLTVNKIIAD